MEFFRSNNTNKWDAQERRNAIALSFSGSNNTNKWDAQELICKERFRLDRSNNTNKWDAQEQATLSKIKARDQIIPINGMLKNDLENKKLYVWIK